ncbi:MAG TPA: hypothetical protein VIL49_14365 [Capillimicrobium sp.]|jgi:hypothetical protein
MSKLARTLSVALAVTAVTAASAEAARFSVPSNANVGEKIMAVGKAKKPGRYTITLTSLSTSGKVCGRDLGKAKRVGRGAWVRWTVAVPRRLPCFKGPRGNGRRVGSQRVSLGQYAVWFGERTKRFFWTKRKTFAVREIGLS